MSNVDVTVPIQGAPTTASVRANMAIIKAELEALEAGGGGGGITEPVGPGTWGRLATGAWERSVAVDGDVMTGPLSLPAVAPAGLTHAAHRSYVDTVAAGLQGQIDILSSNLRFVGGYDVDQDDATFTPGSGLTNGALPAADPAYLGWYLIVVANGTGSGEAPPTALYQGDWLVCTGAAWQELPLGAPAIAAAQVAINPAIGTLGANVQTGLAWLDANHLALTGGVINGPLRVVPPTNWDAYQTMRIGTAATTGSGLVFTNNDATTQAIGFIRDGFALYVSAGTDADYQSDIAYWAADGVRFMQPLDVDAGAEFHNSVHLALDPVGARDAVPKIYVDNLVALTAGVLVVVGAINGATGQCIFTDGSGILPNPGPLPDAEYGRPPAGNENCYVVCDVGGTPPDGPLAGVQLNVGDWVVSDGSAWFVLRFGAGGPFLPMSGGVLSGPLTLAGPPTQPLHAATMAYADAKVADLLQLVGSMNADTGQCVFLPNLGYGNGPLPPATAARARHNVIVTVAGTPPVGAFQQPLNVGDYVACDGTAWSRIAVGNTPGGNGPLVRFIGDWNAATNTPNLITYAATAENGDYFICSVAGTAAAGIPGIGGQVIPVGSYIAWYDDPNNPFDRFDAQGQMAPRYIAVTGDILRQFVLKTGDVMTGHLTVRGGIDTGSNIASDPNDHSQHLSLYPGYGINVTGGFLNLTSPIAMGFYQGTTLRIVIGGADVEIRHSVNISGANSSLLVARDITSRSGVLHLNSYDTAADCIVEMTNGFNGFAIECGWNTGSDMIFGTHVTANAPGIETEVFRLSYASHNATFAGKVTVGAPPTDDLDLATKLYVDDNTGGNGPLITFIGNWNAATNTPDLIVHANTARNGDYFICNVAGTANAGIPGIGGQVIPVGSYIAWYDDPNNPFDRHDAQGGMAPRYIAVTGAILDQFVLKSGDVMTGPLTAVNNVIVNGAAATWLSAFSANNGIAAGVRVGLNPTFNWSIHTPNNGDILEISHNNAPPFMILRDANVTFSNQALYNFVDAGNPFNAGLLVSGTLRVDDRIVVADNTYNFRRDGGRGISLIEWGGGTFDACFHTGAVRTWRMGDIDNVAMTLAIDTGQNIRLVVAGGVGAYGVEPPVTRPVVDGSRGGNAALASLLTALASHGFIEDNTTA